MCSGAFSMAPQAVDLRRSVMTALEIERTTEKVPRTTPGAVGMRRTTYRPDIAYSYDVAANRTRTHPPRWAGVRFTVS